MFGLGQSEPGISQSCSFVKYSSGVSLSDADGKLKTALAC